MARKKLNFKFNLKNKNLSLIFGILLLLIFSVWRYHQVRILSFNTQKLATVKNSNIKPIYIKSYPVGIDIEVGDTTINKGVWSILPNKASYLIDSAGIGDSGNIIIYGHNKDTILGPLRWINKGALIELTGSDQKQYKYRVEIIDTIDPNNLKYIEQKEKETLTIYTCSGFLDTKRVVAVAYPI